MVDKHLPPPLPAGVSTRIKRKKIRRSPPFRMGPDLVKPKIFSKILARVLFALESLELTFSLPTLNVPFPALLSHDNASSRSEIPLSRRWSQRCRCCSRCSSTRSPRTTPSRSSQRRSFFQRSPSRSTRSTTTATSGSGGGCSSRKFVDRIQPTDGCHAEGCRRE